jgi:hypothetical protein
MKTRSVDDVDTDLKNLRNIVADSLRDSEPWKVAWERIDELLEERATMKEPV